MKYIKIIFFAIILLLLVVFAFHNQAPISLVFLSYGGVTYQTLKLPLFAFFYIVILVTIVLVSLLEVIERTSLRAKNKRLQKENAKLQAELTSYTERESAALEQPVKGIDRSAPSAQKKGKKGPTTKKKQADTDVPAQ